MKQLTGLDATFLYMETANTYGHVNGLSIYERPYPEFDPYAAVYERFGSLVGHIEPLRRVVELLMDADLDVRKEAWSVFVQHRGDLIDRYDPKADEAARRPIYERLKSALAP